MKKLVFYSLIGFMFIAVILILLIKPKNNSINILSVENNYMRIITENEPLSIVLFYDDVDNFLLEKTNISRVSISDEYNEIELTIDSIDVSAVPITYQNNHYYEATFNLNFDWNNLEGLNLNFSSAKLNINYINEVKYNFQIGDVNLSFLSLQSPAYLDINRMYGIVNEIGDSKTLLAVALKLDNLTNSPITIKNIYSNNLKLGFNLENTKITKEVYLAETNIQEVIPDYYLIENPNAIDIHLNEENFYIIPLIYLEEYTKITRLPIYIDYLYQNKVHTYVIDDFLFFNEGLNLDANQDKITEYIYNYS
ncbi:MAG: hypothetical protein WCY80_01670 [Candidatus Izemoplasmatales bacterium]